jgi:cholesterol transport system auxiliary component
MSYLFRLLLFFNILTFTGCTLTPPQPALHDFGTGRAPSGNKPAARSDISVEAPKWLQDNRIHYRLLYAEPTRVRFYSLDRWLAPPSELLEQQLKSGGINPQYPLTVRLLDFEQQFESPQKAKVLMRLSVEVYTPDRQVMVDSHEFRFEQACPTPDAKGAVNAFSTLSVKAAERIRSWLDSLTVK